jgi:hypothetical protein
VTRTRKLAKLGPGPQPKGNGMNRREFVWTTASAALASASGAAEWAGRADAQPARFDLVIKGGRVIDPSLNHMVLAGVRVPRA